MPRNVPKGREPTSSLSPALALPSPFQAGRSRSSTFNYLEKQPHVKLAVGVLSAQVETVLALNGVDIPQFQRIAGPGFRFLKGGPPTDPDGLVADEYYARQHHLRIGQTVKFFNHPWHVTGIVQGGVLARLIVSLPRLQEITGNGGRISEVLVKLDNPALTNQMVAYFNDRLQRPSHCYLGRRFRLSVQRRAICRHCRRSSGSSSCWPSSLDFLSSSFRCTPRWWNAHAKSAF